MQRFIVVFSLLAVFAVVCSGLPWINQYQQQNSFGRNLTVYKPIPSAPVYTAPSYYQPTVHLTYPSVVVSENTTCYIVLVGNNLIFEMYYGTASSGLRSPSQWDSISDGICQRCGQEYHDVRLIEDFKLWRDIPNKHDPHEKTTLFCFKPKELWTLESHLFPLIIIFSSFNICFEF